MHNVCSVIGQKRIVFLIFHRNLGLYLMSSWAVLTKNVIDAVAWDQVHMHSKLITWSKCCDVVFHVKEDYFHIVDLCCRAKIYDKIYHEDAFIFWFFKGELFLYQYLHTKLYKGIHTIMQYAHKFKANAINPYRFLLPITASAGCLRNLCRLDYLTSTHYYFLLQISFINH